MKIRSDFITNSSSSAFVVAFPDKVTSVEYVKQFISPEWKADIVHGDVQTQTPTLITSNNTIAIEEIVEALKTGYIDDLDDGYYDQKKKFLEREGIEEKDLIENHAWYDLFYREREIKRTEIATKKAEKFVQDNEGHYLYQFEYGDEDGQKMGEMEHGFTFVNLPHIGISHH